MKELALTLTVPGGNSVNTDSTGFNPSYHSLGDVVSQFLVLALYMGGALMFCWIVWGIFQYIFAGGEKEALSHARKRIISAVIGFILIVLAFTIQQFLHGVLNPTTPNLTPVQAP